MTDQHTLTALRDGTLAGRWSLDPANTTIGLKTKAMWGIVPVKGSFTATGGHAHVGADAAVTATIEVAAASISTKIRKRDEHLRSADFLDAATYPTISVAIDHLDLSGADPLATGTLTVRGAAVPITLSLEVTTAEPDRVELKATTVVDRAALGLQFRKQGATKMDNTLLVTARFIRG